MSPFSFSSFALSPCVVLVGLAIQGCGAIDPGTTGKVNSNMEWSIDFSPDDSAYAWDDPNLIVYALNPTMNVASFRILSGTTQTWRVSKKASDAQWPEERKVYDRDVGAPFVYNHRLEQCILFGGKKVGPPAVASGDTWLFDPSANSSKPWTLLSAKGSAKPSARWRSAAAVNSKGVFYLFGGNSDTILGDFWSLTFQSSTDATWNQITSAGAPPPRFNAALTASGSNLFLFGGWGTGNAALGDLWMFEAKWKVWAPLTVAPAPAPRYTYGMAPNLAAYDDAYTLLIGPGCSDDACSSSAVIQDLLNITNFESSPLAAGSPFLTTRSAIFVAQEQARAYFFQKSAIYYLQLAKTSCDVAVECPGDFDYIKSPDGNELNYATCCDAGRRSRHYDDDDDCDRKFQMPGKNFLLNALGKEHRSLVVGGTIVSTTVVAGMLLAMAMRRRRTLPQRALVPDCDEGHEVLVQPEA